MTFQITGTFWRRLSCRSIMNRSLGWILSEQGQRSSAEGRDRERPIYFDQAQGLLMPSGDMKRSKIRSWKIKLSQSSPNMERIQADRRVDGMQVAVHNEMYTSLPEMWVRLDKEHLLGCGLIVRLSCWPYRGILALMTRSFSAWPIAGVIW